MLAAGRTARRAGARANVARPVAGAPAPRRVIAARYAPDAKATATDNPLMLLRAAADPRERARCEGGRVGPGAAGTTQQR